MMRKREARNSDRLQENPAGMKGPLAILWDIENCCIPNGVSPEEVAGNIRKSLHIRGITGPVTTFSAYGDFSNMPRALREGCQRSGINLIDVPNGRKDAADKAILADMFLFALDNFPPSAILLISGDADFSSALNKLGQRGYTILVAVLNLKRTCSALWNAAKFVWEWPKMARNQSFGESPDHILRKKRIKLTAAELSVNDHLKSSDVCFTKCPFGVQGGCKGMGEHIKCTPRSTSKISEMILNYEDITGTPAKQWGCVPLEHIIGCSLSRNVTEFKLSMVHRC